MILIVMVIYYEPWLVNLLEKKKDGRQGLLLVANCTRLAVAVSRFIYSLTNI